MKIKKHLLKIISVVLTAVLVVSSAGITALAAGETPVGYIVVAPGNFSSDDEVLNSENYAPYMDLLENYSDAISAIYNSVLSMQGSIDVSDYNIPYTYVTALSYVFLYSFPELWYFSGIRGDYYPDTGTLATLYMYYADGDDIAEKTQEFFDAAAQRYLPLIDDSMDDFTKAVILHDAIVLNAYYPEDYQTNRGNNYTFMVQNYGVCQYYSECYAYLLAHCGIKSEVVNCKAMNHAWVKVLIDGKYYNVDATWDDPTDDKVGLADHMYFLWSDEAFQTTDSSMNREAHTNYAAINTADSTFYDGFNDLHSFNTQLCYLDGTFYAIAPDSKLVTYNHLNDEVTVVKNLGFIWPAGGNSYWPGSYSSLAEYGGKLYYNSPTDVYEYDPVTGQSAVFAQGDNGKSLYGLRIMDGALWGVYADDPNVGFVEPTYIKDMPLINHTVTIDDQIIHGSVEANTYSAIKGDTVTLDIAPEEEYTIGGVFVNGEELIPENGIYSFEMPDRDVTVTAEFTFADGVGAQLVGHSLSADGNVGVNFYMELAPEIANSETAYLHFTIPDGEKINELDVPVSEATVKGNFHIFKCGVSAKDMAAQITAQIIDGNTHGTKYYYSVRDYADYLLKHTDNAEYAAAAPVVRAMLNYGAHAQKYFVPDTDPAGLANVGYVTDISGVTASSMRDKAVFANNLSDDAAYAGATLSLRSETSLSLYFRSGSELEFDCEDMTVEAVSTGRYQIARIRGIKSKDLQKSYTLTVKDKNTGNDLGAVTYSPMTYCSSVLSDTNQTEALHNVCKALYLYAAAAGEYFDQLNS